MGITWDKEYAMAVLNESIIRGRKKSYNYNNNNILNSFLQTGWFAPKMNEKYIDKKTFHIILHNSKLF